MNAIAALHNRLRLQGIARVLMHWRCNRCGVSGSTPFQSEWGTARLWNNIVERHHDLKQGRRSHGKPTKNEIQLTDCTEAT